MDLYRINDDIANILAAIDELEAQRELDPNKTQEQIQAYEDTLEGLNLDLEEIGENLAAYAHNAEIEATAYGQEAARWHDKMIASDARAKRAKDLLMWIMRRKDVSKINAGLWQVAIVKNGGKLPLIYNCEPEELPDFYRIEQVSYKPDTSAIRGYLDAGGTSDLFHYGERGEHLRIK